MSKMTAQEAKIQLAYEKGDINDYLVIVTGKFSKVVNVPMCRNVEEARQDVLDGKVDLEVSDEDIEIDEVE